MVKSNPNPKELMDLRAAANVQSVLPDVLNEIAAMEKSTQTKVFEKLRTGALTPQDALSYWMEIFSYHRLRVRMTDKASGANAITETRSITDGQA